MEGRRDEPFKRRMGDVRTYSLNGPASPVFCVCQALLASLIFDPTAKSANFPMNYRCRTAPGRTDGRAERPGRRSVRESRFKDVDRLTPSVGLVR